MGLDCGNCGFPGQQEVTLHRTTELILGCTSFCAVAQGLLTAQSCSVFFPQLSWGKLTYSMHVHTSYPISLVSLTLFGTASSPPTHAQSALVLPGSPTSYWRPLLSLQGTLSVSHLMTYVRVWSYNSNKDCQDFCH